MRAVVTGATGLIGRALLPHLLPPVAVLSRDEKRAAKLLGGVEVHRWDPEEGPAPPQAFRGADVVFHLAGEPAAEGRWTPEKKRRIHDSRVVGTRNLVAGLAAVEKRPKVLVSASAVGYYGDRGDETLDENAAPGRGFLADVCEGWEREAMAAAQLGLRVVCVRVGVVLSLAGGALPRMLPAFRMGAGGRLGNGAQWMPWIHLEDIVGILLHASRTDALRGPLNGVAPSPVTNADFTSALARAVHRPALLPVPAIALRIAFGEMSEILMSSQRVVPRLARETGYAFRHPALDAALLALLTPGTGRAAA
jgi:uncharacterized protein (TIGR01777 family)